MKVTAARQQGQVKVVEILKLGATISEFTGIQNSLRVSLEDYRKKASVYVPATSKL